LQSVAFGFVGEAPLLGFVQGALERGHLELELFLLIDRALVELQEIGA
jgi:hypothetical protein